jgi:hypothetical protein
VVWGRYCACEILIANPIDWLYAACLEYFISFSIDSSELIEVSSLIWAQKGKLYVIYIYRGNFLTNFAEHFAQRL